MKLMKDSLETLVLESNLDLCNKVRYELQDKFENLWLYVYTKSPKSSSAYITIANAFGGKLTKSVSSEIITYAKQFLEKLKS